MFGKKNKKTAAKEADGKTFLAEARAEHDELFSRFVANADEYVSVEEYTDALSDQAWGLSETLAKQSYRNGIRKGRA